MSLSVNNNNAVSYGQNDGSRLSMAFAAVTAASILPTSISSIYFKKVAVPKAPLTEIERKSILKASNNVVSESGLKSKITIFDLSAKNKENLQALSDEKKMAKLVKNGNSKSSAKYNFAAFRNVAKQAKSGNPQFYAKYNSVFIDTDKSAFSFLHELGHAHNYNSTKLWKNMHRIRSPLATLAMYLVYLPLFTKKAESKNGEPLTKKEKAMNALRDSSPYMSAALYMPTIAEEAKASSNANKWAKKLLSPSLAKKVKVTNKFGLLTYAVTGIAFGAASFIGKKIKDKNT